MQVPRQASLKLAPVNKGATPRDDWISQWGFTRRQELMWAKVPSPVRAVAFTPVTGYQSLGVNAPFSCQAPALRIPRPKHHLDGNKRQNFPFNSAGQDFLLYFLQVSKEKCSKRALIYPPPLAHPFPYGYQHGYRYLKLRSHFCNPQMEINSLWKRRSKSIKHFTRLGKPA